MAVAEVQNTCRARALLLVGFGQLRPCGRASLPGTHRTKGPPLGDGGAHAGHRAVDCLILQIEVHTIGAVQDGACDLCGRGAGRRGYGGARWIGDRDTGWHVADASRHDRCQTHLSLQTAFVGQCGARLRARRVPSACGSNDHLSTTASAPQLSTATRPTEAATTRQNNWRPGR